MLTVCEKPVMIGPPPNGYSDRLVFALSEQILVDAYTNTNIYLSEEYDLML
jgi:hypothetical protein